MALSKSDARKLGARAFWAKYGSDEHFRALMDEVWKRQPHDRSKPAVAASLGGKRCGRSTTATPSSRPLSTTA